MIIDNHTHIFSKAIAREYFRKSKADFALVLVDPDELYEVKVWRKFIEFIKKEKKLGLVGSIPYGSGMDKKRVLNLIDDMEKKAQGERIYGIKLYPGYHQFYPFEKSLSYLYEYCLSKRIPVVFHSGDFYDESGRAKVKYSMPIHVDEVAADYPNLKIVISHFGNPWFWETVEIVGGKKNVYTDISGFLWKLDPLSKASSFYADKLKELSAWCGSLDQKLMFGTDFHGENTPLSYTRQYEELVKKVFKVQKSLDNIFYKNAQLVYGIS